MKLGQTIKNDAFQKNEIAANKALSYACAFTSFVTFVVWILIASGVFLIKNTRAVNISFPIVVVLLILPLILSKTKLLYWNGFKYYELFTFTLIIAILNIAIPKHALLAWAACVVISSHYYSPRTVTWTFIAVVVFMSASIPLSMIYGEWDANLMGVTDETFTQLSTLFPDKPLPNGGVDPYNLEDRLYFLNHYNDYYDSLNRWAAGFLYYLAARLICLSVVYVLSYQLNSRTKILYMDEIKSQEEKSRLVTELNVASNIQLSALPKVFPKNKKFDVYALTDAAREVGGDFYNAFTYKDKLCFFIGDVSGKGVPASLLMMKTNTLISSILKGSEDVSKTLMSTNNELCQQNDEGMFVTAVVGVLDLTTGMATFANAGHNPPLLKRANEEYNYFKLPKGFVLGGFENTKYERFDKQFMTGDILFLYTDGVTEAMNSNSELYGEKRLQDLLNSLSDDLSSEEICKAVNDDVKEFVGNAEQSDDITMLCVKYTDKVETSTFVVPADKQEVGRITSFINEFLTKKNINEKILSQIDVAVDEVCSNIFNYAYKNKNKKGKVTVEVIYRNNTVTINFIDTGIKFNPLDKDDPNIDLPLEEREIGGLGIYMVKQLMDDVKYEYTAKKQNILTIVKKVGE